MKIEYLENLMILSEKLNLTKAAEEINKIKQICSAEIRTHCQCDKMAGLFVQFFWLFKMMKISPIPL